MFKISLVEDNANFRQSLKDMLHLQFPSKVIEEAGDGNEALKKVDALHPNLIFMDIRFPGENGLQVTKRKKRISPESRSLFSQVMTLRHTERLRFNAGPITFCQGFVGRDRNID